MAHQKRVALATIAITNLLIMLALSPLTTILPVIAHHFHTEATTASWVMTSFLLSLTSLLLIAGRLGDLYGHRNVFLAGAVLYTIVGTAGAFAQDINALIALRVVQGVAAAMISGNSLAILTHVFTPRERGRAIGVAGMAASFGSLVGVGVSSLLAQYLSWQWLFYLMLPLGLASIKMALSLQVDFRPKERPQVDFLGAILLALALAAFSLSLSHLHAGEASFSAEWRYHAGLLLMGVMALVVFAQVERRAPQPMVALGYLLNGPFSFSIVANEILHMTMMASTFLMPFLLQSGLGLSPVHSAGLIIFTQIGNIATAPISGTIYDRTRWRFLCPTAMALVCLGLAVLAIFGPTMSYPTLLVVSFLLGLCLGFFNTPNNAIIMSTVPAHLRGFAAGMVETSRQLGHTLGVGLSSAVMGFALVGLASNLPQSAVYIVGYQQATLVAAGIAFLGVFTTLVHAFSRQESAEGW